MFARVSLARGLLASRLPSFAPALPSCAAGPSSLRGLERVSPPAAAAAAAAAFATAAQGMLARFSPRAPWLLLPPLTAAWALVADDLAPHIVLTGKGKHRGKNKRIPKAANHGARPANHVGRRQRAAAAGRYKYNPKR
jgi:hypothetical protein